jgi:putative colanic acid biosynthesis UDP-glucose lipid carrier transferase
MSRATEAPNYAAVDGAAASNANADRVEVSGLEPIELANMPLLIAKQSWIALAIKRTLDIAFAALGLLVTLPLLAVLAALIRLDSVGPLLFRQPRMGHRQRPFVMIKLRTMDGSGRVTRMGHLLRPTGLDELPQLWHVLTGQMSVVGPRPEVLERVPRYVAALPNYGMRHLMRPGITGWAQVNGMRGDAAWIPRRISYDLQYIRSFSLALDARILWLTLATVWCDTRRALGR